MTTPAFKVPAGQAIQMTMKCDGIAVFNIFLSELVGGAWVPRPAITPAGGAAVHAGSTPFNVPALTAGQTFLLTIPLLMTPIASGGSVSTTATIIVGGTLEGKVSTPPVQPNDNQAASITMFIELEA
jgi:hypothetical protein